MGSGAKDRDPNKKSSADVSAAWMPLLPEKLVCRGFMWDKTPVTLRCIRPEDADSLCGMFQDCSRRSLYLRFERHLDKVPLDQVVQLCSVDHNCEVAVVAEIEQGETRKVIGLGQLSADPSYVSAEYAVLVADPWQGRGLGSLFTDFCLDIASKLGIKRVVGEFSPSNVRIIRILQSRGFDLQRDEREQFVFAEKDIE